MKVKNPVIMKEIEFMEKEEKELQHAISIIDELYNTVCGMDAEELFVEMEDVKCDCISKEKIYEIGEILESILYADVLYTKKVCTEE